jgi:hypothetical protein
VPPTLRVGFGYEDFFVLIAVALSAVSVVATGNLGRLRRSLARLGSGGDDGDWVFDDSYAGR